MAEFQLGVSIGSISKEFDAELVALVGASRIATFELSGTVLGNEAVRSEFRRMLAETGKRAASWHIPFGFDYDVSSPDETIRSAAVERVREELVSAGGFGCDFAVIHASFEPIPDGEREARIAAVRRSFAELEPALLRYGLRLTVELLPRSCIGNTARELLAMLAGASPTFGACLDVNHLMGDYASLPGIVRQLGERLYTLHLSDYDGVDEKHWLPGEGVIDWPGFCAALREIGYTGPFNYEVRTDSAATPAERIRCLEENFDALMKRC